MWTTPKKHTKNRETLRNANQNKTTRRAGYKNVYEPPRGCNMWTTPEKHTKRRTLGNANQDKTSRRAGYKKVYEKRNTQRKNKESDEMLNKTKTLKTIARLKEAQEKALK